MTDSNLTLCVGSSLHSIDRLQCFVSRVLGSILIPVALFSMAFDLRFLFWSMRHGRHRSRQNLFIFSMIFSSMSVILVILPSVFLQSFTCRRLCSRTPLLSTGRIRFVSQWLCTHVSADDDINYSICDRSARHCSQTTLSPAFESGSVGLLVIGTGLRCSSSVQLESVCSRRSRIPLWTELVRSVDQFAYLFVFHDAIRLLHSLECLVDSQCLRLLRHSPADLPSNKNEWEISDWLSFGEFMSEEKALSPLTSRPVAQLLTRANQDRFESRRNRGETLLWLIADWSIPSKCVMQYV